METLPTGIYLKSSEHMSEIPDQSVHLIVTSPPYNVDKEYEQGMSFDAWKQLLTNVIGECYRILVPNGRMCINVASVGRHPYIPIYHEIITIAYQFQFVMRGTILWLKGGSGPKSSWGSFGKSTDPILRDSHEFVLVFHKGTGKGNDGESGISPEEFLEFTRAEWRFQPETNTLGHPAPFPDELPRRCILLYSNEGDTIVDPFCGSGTTYKVATALHRKAITYELDPKYLPIILKRIKEPIHVQSEAWERHQTIKKKFPTLYQYSVRQLRQFAYDRYKCDISESASKEELLERIGQEVLLGKQTSIQDYFTK